MSVSRIISVQLLFWYTVEAYYCEFGLCGQDSYCCGTNICCQNVHSIWYFWAGVVFVLIVLASFFGFSKFCYTPQCILDKFRGGYTKLPYSRAFQAEDRDLESGAAPPTYEESMRHQ